MLGYPRAHDNFARSLVGKNEKVNGGKNTSLRGVENNLKDFSQGQTGDSVNQPHDSILFGHSIGIDGNRMGQSPRVNRHRDVGSTIRAKKRYAILENAHNSLARHALSASRKDYHHRLFQNHLRLVHSTGKYEDVNFADPKIPVAGVGIALERVSIPSLIIPSADLYELRVTHVQPDSAAGLSRRINVGDVLIKACPIISKLDFQFTSLTSCLNQVDGHSVVREMEAEAMSKVYGPQGSMVVLTTQSIFGSEIRTISLIRGDSRQSALLRQRLMKPPWPDPEKYDNRSICGSGLNNIIRQVCIMLAENRHWNRFVTAAVVLSVALLPFDDPFKSYSQSLKQSSADHITMTEWVIQEVNSVQSFLFVVDVGAKIVAQGFWHGRRAYMRDAFNRLDFVLAIIGIIDFFINSSVPGMNAVRSLRALRVLKAINRFENMKTFIKLIFLTQERLQTAAYIIIFLMLVFAIVSVQLFCGVLRQKCFHLKSGSIFDPALPCSLAVSNCPAGFACIRNGGPVLNSEYSNADNFLFALMVNIQVLTMSKWSVVMQSHMRAYHPAAAVFFVMQIMLLPVYCIQILLAIIATEIEPLQDSRIQASRAIHLEAVARSSNLRLLCLLD